MLLKSIFLISACLLWCCTTSAQRNVGGGTRGGFRSSASIAKNPNRFVSSPSFSNRERPINRLHTPRVASAPPLSSLPSHPNSLHVPREASAPPLNSISGLPAPPNRAPLLPPMESVSSSNNAGSRIPKPPPLPPLPPTIPAKSNVAKTVPMKQSKGDSETVITPVVVSPVMRIASNRNSTTPVTSGSHSLVHSTKATENRSSPQNSTQNWRFLSNNMGQNATTNLLSSERNSKAIQNRDFLNGVNSMNANKTISASPKNATNNLKGNSPLNKTVNGFPLNSTGNNTVKNFTLTSNGINHFNNSQLVNQTRHNNTGNAMGHRFPTGVGETHVPPSVNFPWQGGNNTNNQQNTKNNIGQWDSPAPKYDERKGDPARNPRSDMVGDITKKIIKNVASKKSGPKAAKNVGDNNSNGEIWATKKDVSDTKASSLAIASCPISILLLAGCALIYFCNKK